MRKGSRQLGRDRTSRFGIAGRKRQRNFWGPVVLGNAPRPVYFCFGFGCASLILSKASLALWFAGSSFRAFS
jgi:hypothetical protein